LTYGPMNKTFHFIRIRSFIFYTFLRCTYQCHPFYLLLEKLGPDQN